MSSADPNEPGGFGRGDFQSTCWSVVLAACKGDQRPSDDWRTSLETLCRTYWYPLYAYLRRKGYSPNDCQDLTQEFFATLIEKDFLNSIDPQRGRFRWFLMDAIRKFAANWNAARAAQKRGGGRRIFSLEYEHGESRYLREPVDGWTAERLFDRRWALELLDQAMQRLEDYYRQRGKTRHFHELKVFLTADSSPPSYQEVADRLGLGPTAIKVAIHRLRDKYREMVHQVVADTLEHGESLEDEIDRLLESL
jgi:RNA polymerase sigma-70 factor (ECF subfamily)